MRKNLIDQRTYGPLIIQRIEKKAIPDALAPAVQAFKEIQIELERCATAAELARRLRDEALAVIGVADTGLDGGISGLAKRVAGADLGSLVNPFSGYSKYSVYSLCNLPYASEVTAVRELVAKIAAKGPPQEVTVKIAECLQRASEVERALVALAVPQSDYDEKRAARDEVAMAWSKAFAKLKLRAQLAFEDQPGVFEALFAKPETVQRPVKRRKSKKQQPAESPAVPE